MEKCCEYGSENNYTFFNCESVKKDCKFEMVNGYDFIFEKFTFDRNKDKIVIALFDELTFVGVSETKLLFLNADKKFAVFCSDFIYEVVQRLEDRLW